MSTAAELHSQIASIIEVLANSAVAEICKAVEDGYAVVNLEMSRSLKENECLRRRVRLLELQVSRYRAEQRLKAPPEGAASGRVFPGVRLLQHRSGRDTPAGSSLQSRSRFVNRSVSQPQKTPQTNLDQDPDQEVVTTTKAEPTESEEDSDLVIIKVEGSVSIEDRGVSDHSAPLTAHSSDSQAPSRGQTEVSASQTCSATPDGTLKTHHLNSDVIVIDKEDVPSEKAPSSSLKSAWLSFQTPPSSAETAGTSSSVATSFLTNTSSQRFETFNPSQNPAPFSVSASPSSNPSAASSQSSFGVVRTFTQQPQTARLFPCTKCPMRFFQGTELLKHAASHRSRKYVCDVCGKAFVCKSQLEIHQNVHTGQKPFTCSVCHSRFSHPSNLRRHMKLQHQQHVKN